MNIIYAKKILEDTRGNYNLIADDFSRTRQGLWPELSFLKDYVEDGDKILDLGCGNGRLAELFKDKEIEYVGADVSEKMIKESEKKFQVPMFCLRQKSGSRFLSRGGHRDFKPTTGQPQADKLQSSFIIADGLNLPFENESFDKIFSIAVLHHIPSYELRLKFLSEARRVLKKNGVAVFTVWNLWQKKSVGFQIKYFLLKILGLSRLDFKDILVPYTAKNIKIHRYYHAFTKRELNDLFLKAGFAERKIGLLSRKEKEGNGYYNYYVIVKKSDLR